MTFQGLLTLLLTTCLLSACNQKDNDSFQNIQYQFSYGQADSNSNALENLTASGTVSNIDLGFTHNYAGIKGENLSARWQGTVSLNQDEQRWIQSSGYGKAEVWIDGAKVALNQFIMLEKGKHTIDVRYQPRWHADKFVLNFLPQSEILTQVDKIQLSKKIDLQPEDKIAFIVSAHRQYDDRVQKLSLPQSLEPLVLVLDSEELINWYIENPHKTPVKAIVLLSNSGVVTGSNAPIYRVLDQSIYSNIITGSCLCIGGTQFSCNGSSAIGTFPLIQAMSELFFKRAPDFIGRHDFHKKIYLDWQTFDEWQTRYDTRQKQVQKEKSQCGGKDAITVDNVFSGSLNTPNESWAQKLGITEIPHDAFHAVYLNQDQPKQIIYQETVPNIAINYAYNQFHNLDSEKFMGLWIGRKTFAQDTPVSLQFDLSWAQLKILVDGKTIFNQRHGENGKPQKQKLDYVFTKGEHTIEVQYINHWHTTNFAMNFINYPQVNVRQEIADTIRQRQYDVIQAEVYESENLDGHLSVQVPHTNRSSALLLSSHRKVFWDVQASPQLALIVIEDEKGEVRAPAHIPVIRVQQIPKGLPAVKQFYVYAASEKITAEKFKDTK